VEEEKEEHAERMQGNGLISQNCSTNPLAKETEVVPEIMGFLNGYLFNYRTATDPIFSSSHPPCHSGLHPVSQLLSSSSSSPC
jgi:hypothetical protein